MKRFSFYGLILFFSLLYTEGLWIRIGVPKMLVEGTLATLLVAILLHQRGILHRPPPGFLFVWFYFGWSLVACLYNDEGLLRGLLYPRYLIGSYLVFWIVWSSRFTPRQLLRINTVLLTLFFLQVAAALFYWLVQGRKDEFVVGTMGYGTGGIATTFSVFAFSLLLAFFLYYNRPLFLMGAFSFFLVGYASGKMGIYFLIALMLALGVILYATAEGLRSAIRRSGIILLIGLCTLPFVVFLISQTTRPETESMQKESGLYNQIAAFVRFNSAEQSVLKGRSWYTTTRTTTSQRVMEETLYRGPLVFLFGRGPRLCVGESSQSGEAVSRYGIVYGLVGWAIDALAIGWPAMLAHLGFYVHLFRLLRHHTGWRSLNCYWRAIRLAVQLGFCVFLFSYLLYSIHFTAGGWLSSVYLYLLALLLAPQYQEVLVALPAGSPPPAAYVSGGGAWRARCGSAPRPASPLF